MWMTMCGGGGRQPNGAAVPDAALAQRISSLEKKLAEMELQLTEARKAAASASAQQAPLAATRADASAPRETDATTQPAKAPAQGAASRAAPESDAQLAKLLRAVTEERAELGRLVRLLEKQAAGAVNRPKSPRPQKEQLKAPQPAKPKRVKPAEPSGAEGSSKRNLPLPLRARDEAAKSASAPAGANVDAGDVQYKETLTMSAEAVAELKQEMEQQKESLRRLFQSLLQQASAQGGSTQSLSRANSQNSVRSADAREEPTLSLEQLHRVLAKMGLRRDEHAEVRAIFRDMDLDGSGGISFEEFLDFMLRTTNAESQQDNIVYRALTGRVAVPNFEQLCRDCVEIFEEVAKDESGRIAEYIPELKNSNPKHFGLAICTVDGQTFSYGDAAVGFSMQSCHKPFNYALALEEHGAEEVHKYCGYEPSGREFNAFTLLEDIDGSRKPHNPMINAGAIVCSSLIRKDLPLSERYEYVAKKYARIAGRDKMRFQNTVYLSEKATSDRNHALSFYLRGAGVFRHSERSDLCMEALDFYTQCCSVEVTAEVLATMAATLANRGVCPRTGEKTFSSTTVRQTLKLMLAAGMYDFSGEWAMTIGLPAKSGVAGSIFIVVPNVMGLCVFSPRLDQHGNSARGINLFTRLCERYPIGIFDQLLSREDDVFLRYETDDKGEEKERQTTPRGPGAGAGAGAGAGLYSSMLRAARSLQRERAPAQQQQQQEQQQQQSAPEPVPLAAAARRPTQRMLGDAAATQHAVDDDTDEGGGDSARGESSEARPIALVTVSPPDAAAAASGALLNKPAGGGGASGASTPLQQPSSPEADD